MIGSLENNPAQLGRSAVYLHRQMRLQPNNTKSVHRFRRHWTYTLRDELLPLLSPFLINLFFLSLCFFFLAFFGSAHTHQAPATLFIRTPNCDITLRWRFYAQVTHLLERQNSQFLPRPPANRSSEVRVVR